MTVTCFYPEDMTILENAYINALTDIAVNKCNKEELETLIKYLEDNECKNFS